MTHEMILKLVYRYLNIAVRFYKKRWTSFSRYVCKFSSNIIKLYNIRVDLPVHRDYRCH